MIRGIFSWGKGSYKDEEILNILRSPDHTENQKVQDFLYSRRLVKIFAFGKFRSLLPNDQERQDAYTEAYQKFISRIRSQPNLEIRSIDAFFSNIFNHVCIDAIRSNDTSKRGIQKHIDQADINDSHSFLQSTEDLLNNIIQKFKFAKVQEYLTQLEEPCPTIINRSAEGYTAKEIGKVVNLKEGNVRARKKICLKKLIDLLKSNKELDDE